MLGELFISSSQGWPFESSITSAPNSSNALGQAGMASYKRACDAQMSWRLLGVLTPATTRQSPSL